MNIKASLNLDGRPRRLVRELERPANHFQKKRGQKPFEKLPWKIVAEVCPQEQPPVLCVDLGIVRFDRGTQIQKYLRVVSDDRVDAPADALDNTVKTMSRML